MTSEYFRNSSCRVCGGDKFSMIVDYGNMPLAGDFRFGDAASKSQYFPMDLVMCTACSLVQILNVVSADVIFDDYRYLSSTTETLKSHFRNHAVYLKSLLKDIKEPFVVEFGCNDGVLLRPLKDAGVKAIGVDAAENLVECCIQQGLDSVHGYFNFNLADEIQRTHGKADVITASNVFAHIDDLHAVMLGVDHLLSESGKLVVEVHYVDDLISTNQYDTVYHEHLCYYSIHSLKNLFSQYRFEVVDVMRHDIHGGSVRVTAARKSESNTISASVYEISNFEMDSGYLDPQKYQIFGKSFETHKRDLFELVSGLVRENYSVSAFGAAGRATMLLNYCGLDRSLISYVVDESPSRIGRQVPGVNLPIVSKSHFDDNPTDFCLITAWNFEKEIVGKCDGFLKQGGCFLIPLPTIRELRA